MNRAEVSKIIEEIDFLEYQMMLIDDKRDQWSDEKREEIYDRLDYLESVLQNSYDNAIIREKSEKRKHLTLIK